MPADIQHTLQNLEFPPPPESWQAIEQWLNIEFDADEIKVGQHLYDISMAPPINAWQEISTALHPKSKTAVIIPFRKMAIAASVIGLVGLLAWFFFHNTPGPNQLIIPSTTATASVGGSKDNNKPVTPPVVASNNLPVVPKNRRTYSNRKNIASQAYPSYEFDDDNSSSNIRYASLGNLRAVNTISSPVITAPPIRDAKGKIILDLDVLTPFNDCYVTVTGPNGEQTRISSKFVEMLNALDPAIRPQDYFDMIIRTNSLWKQRFKEWRNKLTQQPSFIPDVANFFDIVSLGDLIGDGNQK